MRNINLLLISCLTAILFIFATCEKVGKVCQVSDPLTEFPWLASMKGEGNISISKAILKDTKKGKKIEGFIIRPNKTYADAITNYYNCSGEEICFEGGIVGNQCKDYEVIKEEVIYENP